MLVATPLLDDPHFSRTVVYLLEHDGGGTVGVVLNRPSHTPVGQVLPDWHDAVSGPAVVFGGGPVQPDGALCLGQLRDNTAEQMSKEVVDGISTIDLDGDVTVIAPRARRLRVFAGHAGWAEGQLADELAQGAWWVFEGSPADLFSAEPRVMWRPGARSPTRAVVLRLATYPEDASLN